MSQVVTCKALSLAYWRTGEASSIGVPLRFLETKKIKGTMIIVKTKNGDHFINDKAVIMVEHLRDKAVVNAYGDKGLYYIVEDVEGVIYTNDAQPTTWQDEGSEIQRLKARLAQLEPKPTADYANDRLIDKMYHEIDRLDIQKLEENKKNYPGCRWRQKAGNAIRFMNVAKEHNIETVGQLLEVGRVRFERFKNMGRLCSDRISEALDNLYGIKSW